MYYLRRDIRPKQALKPKLSACPVGVRFVPQWCTLLCARVGHISPANPRKANDLALKPMKSAALGTTGQESNSRFFHAHDDGAQNAAPPKTGGWAGFSASWGAAFIRSQASRYCSSRHFGDSGRTQTASLPAITAAGKMYQQSLGNT